MKRILLLVCLTSLCGCATTGPKFSKDLPRGPLPLYISSLGGAFPVQGAFDGTYEVHRDFIEVSFEKAEIRILDIQTYHGRRELKTVRIGLATATSDGNWTTTNMTNAYVLNATVQPGERLSLKGTKVRLPIGESLDLSRHWFLIEFASVSIDRPAASQQVGTSYAHGARDGFITAAGSSGPRVGTDD